MRSADLTAAREDARLVSRASVQDALAQGRRVKVLGLLNRLHTDSMHENWNEGLMQASY